jgi:metal-responsive CopG/Arc/MetJ family transcriptional regulator
MSQLTHAKRKSVTCISIDSEVKAYLEERAKEKGVTLSELIREAIYEYVIKISQE